MNCLKLIDHMKCNCTFVNTTVYFARYTVLLLIQEMVFFSFQNSLHHVFLPIN